jgi:hypothetical protein
MRVANAARIRQRCLLHFFPFAESFVGRPAKCRAQGVIYVSTTRRHRVFPMQIENSIFCPKNMGLCDLVACRTDANCHANRRILAHLSVESAHKRPQSRNIAIEAAVLFVDRIREPFLRRDSGLVARFGAGPGRKERRSGAATACASICMANGTI